jgi:uncharacterized repeat protein (TIGR03803 family)
VFELTPNGDGTWSESVLYFFENGGETPKSSLVFDGSGNLYGTTYAGGIGNEGVVFELTPNTDGTWTESDLHGFTGETFGTDGAYPEAGVVFDSLGNLYGTTREGGTGTFGCSEGGCGTVFELTPSPSGWTETILHSFQGGASDGASPQAPLTFDSQGNLYGTTYEGGAADGGADGVVFELTHSSGVWVESVIHNFQSKHDGKNPNGSVVFDGKGNLYGTTSGGPGSEGEGTLFRLTVNASDQWSETGQFKFGRRSGDGELPQGSLAFDALGNLYGTTYAGGSGYGTVFEFRLPPISSDGRWVESLR